MGLMNFFMPGKKQKIVVSPEFPSSSILTIFADNLVEMETNIQVLISEGSTNLKKKIQEEKTSNNALTGYYASFKTLSATVNILIGKSSDNDVVSFSKKILQDYLLNLKLKPSELQNVQFEQILKDLISKSSDLEKIRNLFTNLLARLELKASKRSA